MSKEVNKKEVAKATATKEVAKKEVKKSAEKTGTDFKKVRVDEREQEWLDAFTKAGYNATIGKNHIDFTLKGTGISIAIQKNSLVPYIRFSTTEQLEGIEKIFSVKKYGYEVHMPAKKSDKGDKRFRAVGKRSEDEIQLALELVQKVVELKAKTEPKKAEKPKTEKAEKKPAKAEKKPVEKKADGKKTA